MKTTNGKTPPAPEDFTEDYDELDAEQIVLPPGVERALWRIVNRYWKDELTAYNASTPDGRKGHIAPELYRVINWLKLPEARLVFPVRLRDQRREVADDGYFGTCPKCLRTDGYLNVGRAHWGICHEHRVRWAIGENLFSSWREQTEREREEARRQLERYREEIPTMDYDGDL